MAKKRKSKNKSFLQKLIYIFLAIILVYSVLHYLGLTQEFDTKVQNALNKASSYTEQNAQPQQELPKPDASETSVTKEASSKQTAQDSEQNKHESAKTEAPLLEGNDSYRASSVEIPLCPATMTKGSEGNIRTRLRCLYSCHFPGSYNHRLIIVSIVIIVTAA